MLATLLMGPKVTPPVVYRGNNLINDLTNKIQTYQT